MSGDEKKLLREKSLLGESYGHRSGFAQGVSRQKLFHVLTRAVRRLTWVARFKRSLSSPMEGGQSGSVPHTSFQSYFPNTASSDRNLRAT